MRHYFEMKIEMAIRRSKSLVLVLFMLFTQFPVGEGKVGQANERYELSHDLPVCSKSQEGNSSLYRQISGDDAVAICLKHGEGYQWKFLDGTPTLGQKFNPVKDCSDIVDNLPDAKDGFFWIKHAEGNISKGYCDTHTDGGGYLLIGMKNSPVIWNVPSNENPVDPFENPHWSSKFGDVQVQDFAVQISTTKKFDNTKAHWSYRLHKNRALGNLFGIGSGGCTDDHSGIGDVQYIKDILTETIVTTKFNCSQFGPDVLHGWTRINFCLKNRCPNGYGFNENNPPDQQDMHGSFSYSARSEFSGVTHDATAFVGCDSHQCCACFGPKGGRGHYCAKRCERKNGGVVLRGPVRVWYWIRTRTPKRKWKRCMEFKMKTSAGKFVTYHIDRRTGVAQKGTCSKQFDALLNEGTILVKDKESLNKLPSVPGMISFRKDNDKLYVNKEDGWDEIGSEETTKNLTAKMLQQDKRVRNLIKYLNTSLRSLDSNNSQQDSQAEHLETSMNSTFQRFRNEILQQIGRVETLVINLNTSQGSLEDKISQQDSRLKTGLSKKNSEQDARVQNLERNINLTWQIMEDKLQKIEKKLNITLQTSCKDILAINKFTASGIYWIEPVAKKQLQVYCDMKTHGGGWTLVYSYTFTNYTSFHSSENAITPRPNWPEISANTPISTTPPLSESPLSLGAVDWNIWKNIGRDIMIKSNINDWIVCKPNVGSFVTKKRGSISCRNIKNVATACRGYVPNKIFWRPEGPALLTSNSYYYDFDGDTRSNWPTHDPCGQTRRNSKQGVSNPGGKIYVR